MQQVASVFFVITRKNNKQGIVQNLLAAIID